MIQLTDKQQALVMFLVFVLPAVLIWLGADMPLDRSGISLLAYGIVAGILAFLKELAGWKES